MIQQLPNRPVLTVVSYNNCNDVVSQQNYATMTADLLHLYVQKTNKSSLFFPRKFWFFLDFPIYDHKTSKPSVISSSKILTKNINLLQNLHTLLSFYWSFRIICNFLNNTWIIDTLVTSLEKNWH